MDADASHSDWPSGIPNGNRNVKIVCTNEFSRPAEANNLHQVGGEGGFELSVFAEFEEWADVILALLLGLDIYLTLCRTAIRFVTVVKVVFPVLQQTLEERVDDLVIVLSVGRVQVNFPLILFLIIAIAIVAIIFIVVVALADIGVVLSIQKHVPLANNLEVINIY